MMTLEKFYATPLGCAAQNMAARRLGTVWPDLSGQDVLGLGYTIPYLQPYFSAARRIILAMPGGQGAIAQSHKHGVITCLVEEKLLPFTDARFDRILVVHGVEESDHLTAMMGELWRVTKPEGRVVIIASNRGGLWARSDRSPFGAGRPFSRLQLRDLLKTSGFIPTIWSGALYAPPQKFLASAARLSMCEKFGETVLPGFSGLVLVEAIKRLYVDPSDGNAQRVMRPVFSPAPVGNAATRSET
ncbi:MAG: methyltransferase domain-containing protein [Hyphomonadaceae bacterium]|nr:methyltransferase domain-containing protein [Hyphomonadaceae bacterium]